MLWSTSPKNRLRRGESIKKDIARMPVARKKSRIFKGYSKEMEPPASYFAAKQHTESKKGRYVADLFHQREKASLMMHNNSFLQSSIDQVSD